MNPATESPRTGEPYRLTRPRPRIPTLLVATVAGLWLGVAFRCEAQPPPAPVVDFTVKETKEEGDKQGEWKVRTEVKNNTTSDETIVWWSWPAAKGGAKIGDLTWYPEGTVPEDPDSSKPGHKLPKKSAGGTNPGKSIPAGGTLWGKTKKVGTPHSIYVRAFKKKADGSWEQVAIIAHNVHLAAFHVPETNPRSEYVTIPIRIPYPTDFADATDHKPADFFITDVSLPPTWQLAFLAPDIGERFELQPSQREFTGVLVAKQTREMAEGDRAALDVTWHAQADDGEAYERIIRNIVVKDSTPPSIEVHADETPHGVLVTIEVSDSGGIHHNVHLTTVREGADDGLSESIIVPRKEILREDRQPEIGVTSALYQTLIRSSLEPEELRLQASAMDQFGNAATTKELVVLAGGHPPSGDH